MCVYFYLSGKRERLFLGDLSRTLMSGIAPTVDQAPYLGARFAKIRCKVRRCMFSRRAVSETLWSHSS